jgi:hypothetical protein
VIPAKPAPEPPGFDEKVRKPGLRAIAELVGDPSLPKRPGPQRKKIADHREDIPPDSFPPYWRDTLDEMMAAHKGVCAYMAIHIHKVIGAPTVDHMIPRSVDWSRVYEWDNYRLACSLMNSKKKDAVDVIDPFKVKPGWFELELVGFQVMPGAAISPRIRNQVYRTINRLGLNEPECRELRGDYAEAYWTGEISLEFLLRSAPIVASELRRQGSLRQGDA